MRILNGGRLIHSISLNFLIRTGGRIPQAAEHSGNTQRTAWAIGGIQIVA